MNTFLWGGGANGKGLKWITWKKLYVYKDFGGLVLKELRKFDLAMLTKHGWRLSIEANSLVSAVMKERYYPESSVLNTELGNNPSYVWRGIFQALEVVKAGAQRKIGNGKDTLLRDVPWLPNVRNGFVSTQKYDQMTNITVSSLMVVDDQRWDFDL